jgi:3-mercaptopyruvate sulfurtransferase SseA
MLSVPCSIVVVPCGVTACVVILALATLGKTDVTLYDGAWSEWGALSAG